YDPLKRAEMKQSLVVGRIVFGIGGTAWAGDLVNKDATKYDLEVSCRAGGTTLTSISGNTTQSGRAGKGCTIKTREMTASRPAAIKTSSSKTASSAQANMSAHCW